MRIDEQTAQGAHSNQNKVDPRLTKLTGKISGLMGNISQQTGESLTAHTYSNYQGKNILSGLSPNE